MLQKPSECEGCPLHTIGKGFLKSEGLCNLKVAIIGEAAGKREMWEGLPFRPNAESGSLLEKVFKMCKVSRRDFVLYNIVNCHPPNDYLLGAPWEEGAIEHCRQHLERVLNKYRPNAILALGNTALQALTGYTGIMDFRGYCFPSRYGIPVVGGLHPAYIRRGKSQFTPALVLDLLKAIRVSKGTWNEHIGNPTYLYPNYCEHPSIDEAIAFRNRVYDNSNLLLTYDIENPETAEASEDEREDFTFNEVTQIQFSLGKREGIAFPWEEPYIQIAKEILASDNNKSGHNCWFYDNKVLKQLYGIEVKGRVDDTMWMFHHLYPDLELGLQKVASFCDFPFPWKHLVASQFEFYGCADVDAPQWIMADLPERLKKRGVWEGYEDKVRGFYTVLTNIEDRGVGVDPIARGKFKEELETELERIYAEAQTKAPIEILNSKQKGGYKKTPKEVERLIQRYEHYSNKFASEGKVIKNTLDEYIFKQLSIVDSKGDTLHYVRREFEVGGPEKCKCLNKRTKLYKEKQETGICETCNNTGEVEKEPKRVEVRWCLLKPFLPTSSQQVIRYIKYKAAQDKAKGIKKTKHIVPETLKDKRETTSKDELKRLALSTGDEMYKLIVEYREYNKMLKTDVPNWEPGKDGRVHTSFTFKPATGQLSSRNPNIQNAPKHQKLAKAFRAMIVPSDKRVLVECDYSGFHVVMTGLEAGSKDYVRIAKIDMHSFVTSFLIKQPMRFDMSDEELKDRCKWIKEQTSKNPEGIKHGNMYLKEIRDLKAKPAILGIGFGLGATKLWHMNRESINNIAEAKYLLDLIKDLFPAVFKWQNAVRKEAHEKTFLTSRWGFTRNFFDVYRWTKNKFGKWEYKPGLDSEKAIAFLPANDAFGMVRWVMKKLEAMRCNSRFKLVNTVHDSLVYEPKIKDLDLCCEVVPRVMQKPCPILAHPIICPDGITVEVETSVGENWSKDSLVSIDKWRQTH